MRAPIVGVAIALAFVAGCGSPEDTAQPPDYTDIVPSEPGRGPVDDATVEREFAVYEALEDDPYEKAVRYYPEVNELVVTMWTLGEAPSTRQLKELYEQAQAAAGDADVRFTLIDNDGAAEDWTP